MSRSNAISAQVNGHFNNPAYHKGSLAPGEKVDILSSAKNWGDSGIPDFPYRLVLDRGLSTEYYYLVANLHVYCGIS